MPFFKPSEDFLRFLTMGAAGSIATLEHLQNRHGHNVVPLERATTSNKLWATKLKRLRLPDLLCASCGLRVESRAKTDLAIKVSESASGAEGRNWDYGLRSRDLIALMRWDLETQQISEPRYFTVGALKEAQDLGGSTLGPPKSARDAAERDRQWIARVPGRDGMVVELSADGHTVRTRIATAGGAERSQAYSVPASLPAHLYVRPGERFTGLEDFVIGVVEPPTPDALDCPGITWDYAADLDDPDDVTRYIAVRAAGLRAEPHVRARLEETAATDASFRIRLEALASLVRFDADAYTAGLIEFLSPTTTSAYGDDTAALVMEAIFILTEVGSGVAIEALLAVARDRECPAETRAAAVWGLRNTDPERVIEFLADPADDVALHAIAAAGQLDTERLTQVSALLAADDRAAASAVALLTRQGHRGARALLTAAKEGGPARAWALAGLGSMAKDVVLEAAGGQLEPTLAEALEPLWSLNERNWLARDELSAALAFLEKQTL